VNKNTIMGLALALSPVAAGADSCMSQGAASYEVTAVLSPWVDDNDPTKGATPNGCEGDGKTWAVQYKTSRGGKVVMLKDPKTGAEQPMIKHSCVGADKGQNAKPGQVWYP
jgi:hypothetical protein